MPRTVLHEKTPPIALAPGVWLDRLQPGGRHGPDREVLGPMRGGQTWSDSFLLGSGSDAFQMLIPDIRLPANQLWPLHWHDCWIAVVILDGTCLIGDWWMETGDVLISAGGLEYGPLLIGPDGCQMFEIFARLHEQQGGYALEYRDHPTLQDGNHIFKPREGINLRNEGRMCLPCSGVEGLVKGRLIDGARWDLGEQNDPERGVMGYRMLVEGDRLAPHHYDDWHGLFVMKGGARIGKRDLTKGDVIVAEPGARLEEIVVSAGGAEMFEVARTVRGMERRS